METSRYKGCVENEHKNKYIGEANNGIAQALRAVKIQLHTELVAYIGRNLDSVAKNISFGSSPFDDERIKSLACMCDKLSNMARDIERLF